MAISIIAAALLSAQEIPEQALLQPAPKSVQRAVGRRIEALGRVYEVLGRCASLMTEEEMHAVLIDAQAEPAIAPYLLQKFDEGHRRPKSRKWCDANFQNKTTRLIEVK